MAHVFRLNNGVGLDAVLEEGFATYMEEKTNIYFGYNTWSSLVNYLPYDFDDIAYGYILGMDTFALGLIKVQEIIDDGRLDSFVKKRYESYESGIGKDIINGTVSLEDLEEYTLNNDEPKVSSGHQEFLEAVVNNILFK